MGLAIALEISRNSKLDFANALRALGWFGIIHGSHEWFEMFLLLNPSLIDGNGLSWISLARLVLLASSFLMLLAFGARLIAGPTRLSTLWSVMGVVSGVWALGLLIMAITQRDFKTIASAADVYTRYSLAIPGAVLTAWGLLIQRQKFHQDDMRQFSHDLTLAAFAFALYGGIGQLFTQPSALFPSTYLNSDVFVKTFGIPIQVFRAAMATLAAIFIIRSLRAFEYENRSQIEKLRQAQIDERRRLEETRAELLHRTVTAQEAERQRIARELHDETGQTLTAIGLGLRGLSETIKSNPNRAVQQANQLEDLAGAGLDELQRLVAGLHPPQLDDLGLLAALRWFAAETNKHFNLPVSIHSQGFSANQLAPEINALLYRIVQEAITNAIRHAQATQISVRLESKEQRINLAIEDNGKGFEVERQLNNNEKPSWGLLGIIERASLANGECEIKSIPGRGTIVEVSVPTQNRGE